jgi:hypothetical protein
MDDRKLLGRNEDGLENEIKVVKVINTDINMKFGIEKCARVCLKKVCSKAIYIVIPFVKDIKKLDPKESYKYLGIEENHDIEHKNKK